MQRNLRLRYQVAMGVRCRYLDAQGFIDIETPMLTRSTPGARAMTTQAEPRSSGELSALPQSPQLFTTVDGGLFRPLLSNYQMFP